jgi:hypothetical protein
MANIDNKNLIVLGEKLLTDCPDNDCVIYRNTYKMWNEITEDITRVKGKHSERVLQYEADKLMRELYRMYIGNFAVNQYRRAAQ